nr:hypothetical protein Q903MT_gene2152 [Picea sitchensis]
MLTATMLQWKVDKHKTNWHHMLFLAFHMLFLVFLTAYLFYLYWLDAFKGR